MNRLLDESEVWQAYRGQRHDLFLPAGASAKVRARCRAPAATPLTVAANTA